MTAILRIISANRPGVVFLAAGLLSLAVYLLTVISTVAFHDAGEFALRAYQLGATHSPGAPLFVIIGHLAGWLVVDPALATSLISVFSASITAGLTAVLFYSLTQRILWSVIGALAFALIFTIWGNAVISEAYALSLLFIVCSVVSIFAWRKSDQGDLPNFPWQIALFYGLALAAHFANILLLPAYLLLFLTGKKSGRVNCLKFIFVTLAFIALIALANLFLANNKIPFGSVSPDSLATLFLYMSGSQHDPLMLRGTEFYWTRVSEHFVIFSRHYWFVLVPVGLIGAVQAYLKDQVSGLFLALGFLIYMGYFTLFGSGDYFLMVGPAYFIFSTWVIFGLLYLSELMPWRQSHLIFSALLIVVTVLSFQMQFGGRYKEARSAYAERYVLNAFAVIPESSIVISRWSEFTAMNYMQVVEGMRPDLKIVVPARELRSYEHGEVQDYLAYADSAICRSPVVTNKITADIEKQYKLIALGNASGWFQLEPKIPCATGS